MAKKITLSPDEMKNEIENFTKLFSNLIKTISVAGDTLELTDDKAASFVRTIHDELSPDKLNAGEIASTMMSQLQDQLESAGKNITIPNLIKQLEGLGVDDHIIKSMKDWAKERNQYVLGIKSLAEELGAQLIKPFEGMTDWIKKIPGGKLLHKMFGFDDIKKKIQRNITEKLASSIKDGTMSLKTMKDVGVGAFKSMGKAAQAAFAHPVLLAIVLIIGALYLAWKQWNKVIDAAKSLRDATGMTGERAKELADELVPIADKWTAIGANMELVSKTTGALINQFKTADILTDGMKENAAVLSASFGVGEENAAKIVQLFKTMGVDSDTVAFNLQASIADAADFAGVGINKVFDDMATSSKEIHTYFRGNVIEAAKAAIELRRMGSSLKEAAAVAKSMLDFESSITSELEASVLLGRQLDFSAARYYAFTGDIKQQQKEILRQVGSLSEFNKLLPFQKEAIAKASGMEVDQLANMLEQQKLIAEMTSTQKQEYKEATDQIGKMNKMTAEQVVIEKQRQVAQEKFGKVWEALLFKLAQVAFPLFDAIYETVSKVADAVTKMFSGDEGEKLLAELKEAFSEFGDMIVETLPGIIATMKVLIPYFTFVFKFLLTLNTMIAKLIMFVIRLGVFLYDAIFRPMEAVKTLQGVFGDLGKGLQTWWEMMKATVFKPFIDMIEWIKGAWTDIGDFFGFGESTEIKVTKEEEGNTKTIDATQIAPTATGGIVTRPQVRLVGEAGPEAIIPLDRLGTEFNNNNVAGKIDELITKSNTSLNNKNFIEKIDELITKSDSTIVTKKLDELIVAIQSMTIVMDHRKVGEVLAANTSHPGFGG